MLNMGDVLNVSNLEKGSMLIIIIIIFVWVNKNNCMVQIFHFDLHVCHGILSAIGKIMDSLNNEYPKTIKP